MNVSYRREFSVEAEASRRLTLAVLTAELSATCTSACRLGFQLFCFFKSGICQRANFARFPIPDLGKWDSRKPNCGVYSTWATAQFCRGPHVRRRLFLSVYQPRSQHLRCSYRRERA